MSSNKTPILPYDIWERITLHASPCTKSLVALCLVSRDMRSLASPWFYRTIQIWHSKQATLFLASVVGNGYLASLVYSLSLQGRLEQSELATIIVALRAMRNLRHLFVHSLDQVIRRDVSVLDAIEGLSGLQSIRLDIPSPACQRVFDRLPAMANIDVSLDPNTSKSIPAFERLLVRSASSLVRLKVAGDYYVDAFLQRVPEVVWDTAVDVTLPEIRSLRLAHAFPNVQRLNITWSSHTPTHLLCNSTSFPALQHLNILLVGSQTLGPDTRPGQRALRHLGVQLSPGFPVHFFRLFDLCALHTLRLALPFSTDARSATPDILTILRRCTSLRYLALLLKTAVLAKALSAVMEMLSSASANLPDLYDITVSIQSKELVPDCAVEDHVQPLFTLFPSLRVLRLGLQGAYSRWGREDGGGDEAVRRPAQPERGEPAGTVSLWLPYGTTDGLPHTIADIAGMADEGYSTLTRATWIE